MPTTPQLPQSPPPPVVPVSSGGVYFPYPMGPSGMLFGGG